MSDHLWSAIFCVMVYLLQRSLNQTLVTLSFDFIQTSAKQWSPKVRITLMNLFQKVLSVLGLQVKLLKYKRESLKEYGKNFVCFFEQFGSFLSAKARFQADTNLVFIMLTKMKNQLTKKTNRS